MLSFEGYTRVEGYIGFTFNHISHSAGGVMLNCVLSRMQIIELMWT